VSPKLVAQQMTTAVCLHYSINLTHATLKGTFHIHFISGNHTIILVHVVPTTIKVGNTASTKSRNFSHE